MTLEEIAQRLDALSEELGQPELYDLAEGITAYFEEKDRLQDTISSLNQHIQRLQDPRERERMQYEESRRLNELRMDAQRFAMYTPTMTMSSPPIFTV